MLLSVSDEVLPLIIKKNVRVNVKYIKGNWIGLDNKQKKKRYNNNNNNNNKDKIVTIII